MTVSRSNLDIISTKSYNFESLSSNFAYMRPIEASGLCLLTCTHVIDMVSQLFWSIKYNMYNCAQPAVVFEYLSWEELINIPYLSNSLAPLYQLLYFHLTFSTVRISGMLTKEDVVFVAIRIKDQGDTRPDILDPIKDTLTVSVCEQNGVES